MTRRPKTAVVPITWVLVADRSRARIMSLDGDDISEVETLVNPQGSMHQTDCVSDRQGYFRGREGSLEAGDSRTDFRHKSAERFVADVAKLLEAGRNNRKFGRLILIAAPMFLGALRSKLTDSLKQLVELEVAKEYTHCSPQEVAEHLAALRLSPEK